MKNFIHEFKQFAVRGNVIDLAVGVIVGGAFGKITSSLVADIVTPLIGIIGGAGPVAFESIKIGPVAVGHFLQTCIDFLIVAFMVFLMVKGINKLKRKQKDAPQPEFNKEEQLLTEIRDLLREGKSMK